MLKITVSVPIDGRPSPARLSLSIDNADAMGRNEIARVAQWLDAIQAQLATDRNERNERSYAIPDR